MTHQLAAGKNPRRVAVGAVLTAVAVALVSTASAAPISNDVGIQTGFGALGTINVGQTSTTSTSFTFSVIVSGDAVAPVTVHLGVPAGLTMGTPVTGSSGPCTGATDLVCTGALAQDFNLSAQWAWNVVAAGPGSYSIAATVSSSDSDPAPSNNSTTFAFTVAAPSGGGGGGGGSGGGGASVTASAVKVSPAHPKAGATVTASIGVTRGGSPVRVGHVTCAATAGSAKVPGRGQHGLGSASCAFKTSAAEKGRALRGSVSVSAGGKSLRRSFSARLR